MLLGAWMAVMLSSCGASQADAGDGNDMVRGSYVADTAVVRVMRLENRTFSRHIVCNGRLEAVRKANIGFSTSGRVADVLVKEGDAVRSGQVLGGIDRTDAGLRMRSARLAYDRAVVALEDRLLDYGLTIADTASMSPERKRSIFMNTGFADAALAMESAEREYMNCTLTAPFAGKVANLQARQYESAGSFCTLVDDSRFIVHFNVLETEYPLMKPGLKTVVTPLSGDVGIIGSIQSVNPAVGQNGQIPVTAVIPGGPDLIDGLNVKIVVESDTGNRLVVPKSAVVIRDGHPVVFTCKDGLSHWVYVRIIDSNSDEHCIEADKSRDAKLSEGEFVIIDGNSTLADNSPVILM